MDIDLHDNMLIICENDVKMYILKYIDDNHLFLNVKFLTKKEFFEKYLFKIKDEAIYYVKNKYNCKVSIAKMYLDNIYYIENKDYQSDKLIFLNNLKNDLIKNDLIIYNDDFKKTLKNFEIYVIGYSYLDNNEISILNKLNARYEKFKNKNTYKEAFLFDSLENEIIYVCKCICNLILSGIDINKIKLLNIPSDYLLQIKKYFKFYNIPINIKSNKSLYSYEIANTFFENYEKDINKTLEKISNYSDEQIKLVTQICNKYVKINDYLLVKDLIKDDFKNVYLQNENLKNAVNIIDITYPISDDDYVFALSFNEGVIPLCQKDECYITDYIKNEVGLKKTYEINKEIRSYTENKINSINHLIITLKKKGLNGDYYPSSLLSKMNIKITSKDIFDGNDYSFLACKLEYLKKLDLLYKYNQNENLDIYQNTFNNTLYRSYDSSFKNVNKKYLNDNLYLSYTSLNNYNKCPFKYFLSNVLKLDIYEDNFMTFIGSLFHDVLEKCLENNNDIETEINIFLKNNKRDLTYKEKFYLEKIKKEMHDVINIINDQKKYTTFDKALYEQKYDIKINDKITFTGKIDKILYKEEDNKTLISVIDYKTGNINADLKNTYYGLNMQLPIYLYLIFKSNSFNSPIYVGIYFQMLFSNDNKKDDKTLLMKKKDSLKLLGYSLNDPNYLELFDKTYENSELIKGLKVKKDGSFYNYSKVLNEDEIMGLINLTDNIIKKSGNDILNGKFDINPIKLGFNDNTGCDYCKFKDICFKNENAGKIVEPKDDLSFLGGDF